MLVQSHAKKGETPWPVAALKPKKVVETYSAGVKLAMVARGEADLYVNTYANFSDWDICAGDILVTEAGGTVTETCRHAGPVRDARQCRARGLLASNGRIQAAAVAALKGRGGVRPVPLTRHRPHAPRRGTRLTSPASGTEWESPAA